tara:strand:- start:473 stop:1177 length:705 start_codon:yes stop_codon:yes gene_type:complete
MNNSNLPSLAELSTVQLWRDSIKAGAAHELCQELWNNDQGKKEIKNIVAQECQDVISVTLMGDLGSHITGLIPCSNVPNWLMLALSNNQNKFTRYFNPHLPSNTVCFDKENAGAWIVKALTEQFHNTDIHWFDILDKLGVDVDESEMNMEFDEFFANNGDEVWECLEHWMTVTFDRNNILWEEEWGGQLREDFSFITQSELLETTNIVRTVKVTVIFGMPRDRSHSAGERFGFE